LLKKEKNFEFFMVLQYFYSFYEHGYEKELNKKQEKKKRTKEKIL